MPNFNQKRSKAVSQFIRQAQELALDQSVARRITWFEPGEPVRRTTDDAEFVVAKHDKMGLQLEGVSGYFAANKFVRI